MAALDSWLPMAQAAGYAVSHVPLSDASRAAWNQSAAEAYIFDTLGLPYGYHNFIMTFFGMCCAWRIRAAVVCTRFHQLLRTAAAAMVRTMRACHAVLAFCQCCRHTGWQPAVACLLAAD
ncbi:MAG: hypothetical protein EOO41_02160 [Methanobacteriota archaeon]|nr:MAG: hypothetical protein EOO41_02160 [Euryarchaeota archaeon]